MPYTQREKGERKRGGKDKPDGETEMGVFRSGRAHRRVGSWSLESRCDWEQRQAGLSWSRPWPGSRSRIKKKKKKITLSFLNLLLFFSGYWRFGSVVQFWQYLWPQTGIKAGRGLHLVPVRTYVIDNLSEPGVLHLLQSNDHIYFPELLEELKEMDVE